MRRPAPPSLEGLTAASFGLLGLAIGSRPIADNSAFTHIRTGIDALAGRGIPRTDPYSFTARGEEWVVQSWLMSFLYGLAHRLAGFEGVVVINALLTGFLAVLLVCLVRTGSVLRTAGAAAAALFAGALYWSQRPLLTGLVCMAAVLLVVTRRHSPLWLLPVMWIWVNSHGTYPLAVIWLGLHVFGVASEARSIDDLRRLIDPYLAYGAAMAGAIALGAINPLGPKLLLFPLQVTERPEIFRAIVEWRSPDFGRPGGLVTLVAIGVCLGVLLVRRTPPAHALPVVVFFVAGLFAQRNLPVAALVFAPALGAALAVNHDRASREAPSFHFVLTAALVAIGGGVLASAFSREPLRVVRYPVAAVASLEDQGVIDGSRRLIHEDKVGAYLILQRGTEANVFVDDRAGLYEPQVIRDLLDLQRGERVLEILEDHDAEAVLWERGSGVDAAVSADPGWRRVHRDDDWVAFVRRSAR